MDGMNNNINVRLKYIYLMDIKDGKFFAYLLQPIYFSQHCYLGLNFSCIV